MNNKYKILVVEDEINIRNLLVALLETNGYAAIIKEIWGYNDLNSKKKLQVNMANIRKKFGAKPGKHNYIENELGVGYRMCEQEESL